MTTYAILKFAASHRLSAHVLWGDSTKITSYTVADASTSVCLYAWSDHAFAVDDPHATSMITQSKSVRA